MKKLYPVIIALFFLLISQNAFASDIDHESHNTVLTEICLENENGIEFCGKFYCEDCNEYYHDTIDSEDVGMPIINIEDNDNLDKVTKENKLAFPISYQSEAKSFECTATFKWQGTTSIEFPKKNYSIQLFEDASLDKKNKVELFKGCGEQSKYCLKANWVDFSQARNIVSGQIYNEIVKSRGKDDQLGNLANGGVVDGYPVLVYRDGVFYGLFTLNIPKDKWMFGMNDETKNQALLFADNWQKSPKLLSKIKNANDVSTSGWDIEYCSTEDSTWAVELMNDFIEYLNNDRSNFKKLSDYVDVDRAIDVMIYTYFIYGTDNAAKNIMWACYDGKTWIPSVYDMDGTWGMKWDGSFYNDAETAFTPAETNSTSKINPYSLDYQYNAGTGNMLFLRLLETYPEEIKARYKELRQNILTKDHVNDMFDSFFEQIPSYVYDAERAKWEDAPSNSSNDLHPQQIKSAIEARIKCLDNYFGTEEKKKQCFLSTLFSSLSK